MRRLPTFLLLVLVLALLALAPASAAPDSGTPAWIAVPDYVAVDGQIDLVVFTRVAESTFTIDQCELLIPSGTYEVRRMVIQDRSSGQAGSVTGVIASESLKPGSRLVNIVNQGTCQTTDQSFSVYYGVTE